MRSGGRPPAQAAGTKQHCVCRHVHGQRARRCTHRTSLDFYPASAHVRMVAAVSALLQLEHVRLDERWPESGSTSTVLTRYGGCTIGGHTAVVAYNNGDATSHDAHSVDIERHRELAHADLLPPTSAGGEHFQRTTRGKCWGGTSSGRHAETDVWPFLSTGSFPGNAPPNGEEVSSFGTEAHLRHECPGEEGRA